MAHSAPGGMRLLGFLPPDAPPLSRPVAPAPAALPDVEALRLQYATAVADEHRLAVAQTALKGQWDAAARRVPLLQGRRDQAAAVYADTLVAQLDAALQAVQAEVAGFERHRLRLIPQREAACAAVIEAQQAWQTAQIAARRHARAPLRPALEG